MARSQIQLDTNRQRISVRPYLGGIDQFFHGPSYLAKHPNPSVVIVARVTTKGQVTDGNLKDQIINAKVQTILANPSARIVGVIKPPHGHHRGNDPSWMKAPTKRYIKEHGPSLILAGESENRYVRNIEYDHKNHKLEATTEDYERMKDATHGLPIALVGAGGKEQGFQRSYETKRGGAGRPTKYRMRRDERKAICLSWFSVLVKATLSLRDMQRWFKNKRIKVSHKTIREWLREWKSGSPSADSATKSNPSPVASSIVGNTVPMQPISVCSNHPMNNTNATTHSVSGGSVHHHSGSATLASCPISSGGTNVSVPTCTAKLHGNTVFSMQKRQEEDWWEFERLQFRWHPVSDNGCRASHQKRWEGTG